MSTEIDSAHALTESQARALFEKEFVPHMDAMYNFALRLTNDEDDAHADDPNDDDIRRESEHVLEYIRSSYSYKRENLEVTSRSDAIENFVLVTPLASKAA